jgi:hypothetical protein
VIEQSSSGTRQYAAKLDERVEEGSHTIETFLVSPPLTETTEISRRRALGALGR